MNHPLLFLATRSFWNALLFRVRRLRRPKYLAAAVIGACYFYFYFFRLLGLDGGRKGMLTAMPVNGIGPLFGAAILFAAVLIFAWILPASRAALQFSEAEIAFLFPAPFSRRALVRFKLLRGQFGILFTVVLMTLLTGRGAQGGAVWLHLLGWWIIISTLQLHRLGASFALQRLTDRGMADGRRRLAFLLAAVAVVAGLVAWRQSAPAAPELAALPTPGRVFDYFRELLTAGPAPALLAPFRIVVAPYFAADGAAFLRALGPSLALLSLHGWWVLRADVSFEEAAISLAEKRAATIAAMQRGEFRFRRRSRDGRQPLFALRPTGFPAIAFVWKTLLRYGGRRTLGLWAGAVFLVFAAGGALAFSGAALALRIALGGAAYVVFLLSIIITANSAARQFRQGAAAMDVLKSYPLPGWQIVFGELLAPIAVGVALQCGVLALTVLAIHVLPEGQAARPYALAGAAVGALLLPGLNFLLASIPCAGTLLFPAWIRPGTAGSAGIETIGLGILLLLGQLLALVLALVPVSLAGFLVWLAVKWFAGVAAAALAAGLAAALTLLGEAALGLVLLGWLFARFDPSEER